MAYGGRRQHDMGKDYKSMQEFLDGQTDFTLDEMFNTFLGYSFRTKKASADVYDSIFLEARRLMEHQGFDFFEPIAFTKLADTRQAFTIAVYAVAVDMGFIESVDSQSGLDRLRRLKLDLKMLGFGLPGGI